ncbi:Ubiquitin conjugation factor E4 [Phanerochaete sordida]|uniref:RING-type E3 ubiquitin transferase n=1 Tax=Phanerochaete sordida TaxID=48140 RepID=A0A9P3LKE4_9APHY|nr:Ubiquitin conjugation factor E4 [Phanerochaete sordida]
MSTNPQDDAERIRLKRLAKLQGVASSSPSPAQTPASASSTPPASKPQTPPPQTKPQPKPITIKRPADTPAQPATAPPKKKAPSAPLKFDLPTWEDETIRTVLNVTLDREQAEKTGWEVVWLKSLAAELESEAPDAPKPIRLHSDIIDRLLIARLELDPQGMSDDLEYLPVLASLQPQTVFEYLVSSWKRINTARSALLKKNYSPPDTMRGVEVLDKIRDLVISYAGLTLQEPEMFPQPSGKPIGAPEFVANLINLSSLAAPLLSVQSSSSAVLYPSDVQPFLQDLARRFDNEDQELDAVLGPVLRGLCFHEALFRPEGLAGGDASWRGVISGLEALISVKPIANMLTRLEDFNPPNAQAHNIELVSLFGPILRLGVFDREWPSISAAYFTKAEGRPATDLESARASLRGTLKSLQASMFQIFNSLVRNSAESREAVLNYFARIIALNVRRAGMQVEPETVASDSFMVNLQAILFRFCEPFIDANYSKIDRIDPLYFAHSSRIDLKEETRINAASQEAEEWRSQYANDGAPAPNFISDIFYITLAMNHYGYHKTITSFEELARQYDEMQRHLEQLEGDGSWRTTPLRARMEAAINAVKTEMDKVRAAQMAYETQLAEPELVFRAISFTNFVSTWLIRLADPKHQHPNPPVELPLPQDVPISFKVLPEYAIEDVVEFHLFAIRAAPDSLELTGKVELMMWALTFLTSTWYIKNPFLKSKMVEALSYACWKWDGRRSILESVLNTHPMALKYLMPALIHFYIEVEQTGASSQFYDKFNARRAISHVFRIIWNNPQHRDALKAQTKTNMDRFVRFVNLMINDVTYLLDECLTDLAKIHELQTEMADTEAFSRLTQQQRREREGNLRSLERQTTTYTQLGSSTVALLKMFTAETKEPFMVPEIVDRLAAMLDYNLDALAGPRCRDLKVKDREKYKFNPGALLGDILGVYLNLSDQGEFARAVANDGRSYKKEIFERAFFFATKHFLLKSENDIERLRLFVVKVEETKATIEAEEDMGDVPDEFLDPLMYTLMRDPVILPSSRSTIDRSTIKAHLLSDAKDPFNRMPLSIDDVVPNVELKAKIDAFLAERKNKNTAFDKPESELVDMHKDEDAMDIS